MTHNTKERELDKLVKRYIALGYSKKEAIFKAQYAYSMRT
jgi:hypothetical protein